MPSAASMLASPDGVSGNERLPDNINPNINLQCVGKRIVTPEELDENYRDAFDEREIFDMIRYVGFNNTFVLTSSSFSPCIIKILLIIIKFVV